MYERSTLLDVIKSFKAKLKSLNLWAGFLEWGGHLPQLSARATAILFSMTPHCSPSCDLWADFANWLLKGPDSFCYRKHVGYTWRNPFRQNVPQSPGWPARGTWIYFAVWNLGPPWKSNLRLLICMGARSFSGINSTTEFGVQTWLVMSGQLKMGQAAEDKILGWTE